MNYSKEEFFDLMEQVEEQGGEHLDYICAAREYEFTGEKPVPSTLPGCGNSALFSVPYDDTMKEQCVQVCAVDDDMGRWPRFGGDRFGRDEE